MGIREGREGMGLYTRRKGNSHWITYVMLARAPE